MAMQGASKETAATPAADSPPDGGSTTPSTPPATVEFDAEAIAQRPEITEAFAKVFGPEPAPAGEGRTPTPRPGQSAEENAEELEGLEGTTETDDGTEPDEAKVAGAKGKDETAGARVETEGGAEEGAEKTEAPTLNPLLRHAARRAGWSDEDIDELATAKPELADKTFKKLLGSFNDLSAQYGRLGQVGEPPAAPPGYPPGYAAGGYAPGAVATPQPQPQQPNMLQQLYGPKLQTFQEKYGADFVEEVLGPLVGPMQTMMDNSERQKIQSIGKEIGDFFKGLPDDFGSMYGEGAQVSEDQFNSRRTVAMRADQIRYGASRQGIELSVSECLERANMEFASEHMATLERKRITDEVKARSEQITERPTQTGAPTGQPAERSKAAAEAAYAQRAVELDYSVAP